jgi:selenocysteine lyase/cysteine desulfurase
MSLDTLHAITDHLQLERDVGAYAAARLAKSQTEQFYARVANLINASSPDEIAFMDSASRGWNMAVRGAPIDTGDTIVTLSTEFGTNLIALYDFAQKVGATIRVIECGVKGTFPLDAIEHALQQGACAIALSHAAAQGSIVNPVEAIGALAQKYSALYIVDGCQAVGQIHVDVASIQCDAYIGTGRKWLCGPRGTGFLYIKASSSFRATQLDLASADLDLDADSHVRGVTVRTDARRFELWERSIAGMLGLSSAIGEYLSKDHTVVSDRIRVLSNRLREAIARNTNLRLCGTLRSESGIVGFYLNDAKRENSVREAFEKADVGISTMKNWDCPLYFPKNGASEIFRLSPHHYTPDSTIHHVLDVISRL